jgi:uncharacterized SAM-binding protein YcdF (DUF218 family)
MFFIISKALSFFAVPSNFAGMVCVIGALLTMTRSRRLGVNMMAIGIAAIVVMGFSPLGNVLLLSLSERFPAWTDDGRSPDGIIVLGGAINPDISEARHAVELNASAERMTVIAALARQFPAAPIVFTGGSSNLIEPGVSESKFAKPLLESFGIAPERIVLETRSRTTSENATLTHDLLQPKLGQHWLLVTSAYHMPRSMAAFRAAGFDIAAYPVDWRTRGWSEALTPFETLSAGLNRTDTAAHEWIGLIAYRLAGRSSELLPSPKTKAQ